MSKPEVKLELSQEALNKNLILAQLKLHIVNEPLEESLTGSLFCGLCGNLQAENFPPAHWAGCEWNIKLFDMLAKLLSIEVYTK